MSTALMRWIDRVLGGFLVVILARVLGHGRPGACAQQPGFGPNPAPGSDQRPAALPDVRTIVVTKYFGLGSILLLVPLLRGIKQRFPAGRVCFVSFASNQELIDRLPFVDTSIGIRTSLRHFVGDTLRALWRLRQLRPELVFDAEFFSRFSALMSVGSCAATRVGFHTMSLKSRGRLQTHRVYWNASRHAVDNFLALGAAVGLATGDRSLALPTSAEEVRADQAHLAREQLTPGRYILCSPHAHSLAPLKHYPVERWLALTRLLHQRTGLPVIFVGSRVSPEQDVPMAGLNGIARNLTGRTPLAALLALIRHAGCVISVDSGVAHLAAVFQVPALTLFGPEAPETFGPLNPRGRIVARRLHCSPCLNLLEGKVSDCRDNICINRWTPEELAEQAVAMLSAAG